jgi:3D-(3,5/4)-trihydroxycyclohexane-1,2-dione acylhydrolase (decyclizing)
MRDFSHGEVLPVDLAMNARSYGVDVIEVAPGPAVVDRLRAAVAAAKASDRTTVIHVESDPTVYAPEGEGWWDVPIAEVSSTDSAQRARAEYEQQRTAQRPLLG